MEGLMRASKWIGRERERQVNHMSQWGTTTALMSWVSPLLWMGEIFNLATDCDGIWGEEPATPNT